MPLNALQYIGKYQLQALVGHGSMGVVYKAFDPEIDREVAIKILHEYLLHGEMGKELAQRFRHEVKAAARCQHHNIVTVYDSGFHNHVPYMVMEYVKGIDLQIFLKSGQAITAHQGIGAILKVLDALSFAHSMGVVHRDIKPANIMLLSNGQVKVTDFGVAHIESSDLTQFGDVVGTPSYMAPETLQHGKATQLSDLYAVGLVLLELLARKRLKVESLSYDAVLTALKSQNLTGRLAFKLANVLSKALQPDPSRRFANALAFHGALAECLEAVEQFQLGGSVSSSIKNEEDATVIRVQTDFRVLHSLQGKSVEQVVDHPIKVSEQPPSVIKEQSVSHLGIVAETQNMLTISSTQQGGMLIVNLVGRIDASNAKELEQQCLQWIKGGENHLIFDFTEVNYISSAALRVFLLLSKRLATTKGSVRLCGLNATIRDVFDISGFSKLFPITDTVQEALG